MWRAEVEFSAVRYTNGGGWCHVVSVFHGCMRVRLPATNGLFIAVDDYRNYPKHFRADRGGVPANLVSAARVRVP